MMSNNKLPEVLPESPCAIVGAWLRQATTDEVQRNPNSMTVATVDDSGQPTARILLCKEFIVDPGYLVFYTNYQSRKSHEIDANPKVGVVFHWDSLGLQIRMDGLALRSPEEESDEYFASRDWRSQLGAWGSDQSEPVESHQALVDQVRARAKKLGFALSADLESLTNGEHNVVARPPHWGGYRVWPTSIELWIEGPNRVHDRARWTRSLARESEHSFICHPWSATRLQP